MSGRNKKMEKTWNGKIMKFHMTKILHIKKKNFGVAKEFHTVKNFLFGKLFNCQKVLFEFML